MRDVVSSIELGKSHGPYRLHHAQEVSSLPHCAAVTAADFGDSVSTVSGVSGVAGASRLAGASGVAGVSGALDWGTSTALEVALQVMVLCR